MFGLSKLLGFFLLPSNLLILPALIGILVLMGTRFRRLGQILDYLRGAAARRHRHRAGR